jgi:hypothetical protein
VEIMGGLPDALNRLAARLETLERRVEALEHPSGASIAEPTPSLRVLEPIPSPASQAGDPLSIALAGGAFQVLGKAMLGIAGAYLLRAVAESTSLPKLGVAAIAIAYAMFWLVAATRTPAGAWFASTTYACTSALILAPLLWELTLRFNVLPTPAAAGVLGAFICAATALAWKRNLASVFWVVNTMAALVAVVLSIATHEVVPFTAVLLLMVLLSEYAVERGRGQGVQFLVAAAADIAIWALIFIYSSPQSTRADYPVLGTAALLAPAFILFAIYGVSVTVKTALLRQKITAFETIQTTIAFLLAASSLLYFEPGGGTIDLGVACLILSATGYAAVFALFDRVPEKRNYRIFANWSAALLLAGCVLCLPPLWMAASLGVVSVVCTFLGARLSRMVLQFHGLAYLLAGAVASGLLAYTLNALAGTLPGAPSMSVCLVSVCAILCYAAGKLCRGEGWSQRVLPYVSATLAIGAIVSLIVEGLMGLLVPLSLSMNPGPHHVAFIRTFTICAGALALAFSGAHWRRTELTRIGYAALVLVAAKLVFEDLRHGHLEFIAASIFLFAVTLIVVPRITRMEPRA